LKVHPLAGFYPSQAEVYPLYERCQALDLPVLIHTGMDPAPLRSKYGRPAEVDEVANDFPDLRIVCAHMGGVWREEAVGVAQHHENVWLDVCGTESLLRRDRVGFYRRLREDLDILGADKLCFASDFPYYGSPAALGRWVRTFGEPSAEAGAAGITFSDEEIGGILHGNAERWLGASLSGAAGGSGES
jgi:hypothetical protein